MKKSYQSLSNILPYAIIILGIFFRLYSLQSKAIDHDESLHGYYSLTQAANYSQSHYQYNPMLHGPLLYHLTSLSFLVFGKSHFSLRIVPVIFGIVLVFLVALFFKRRLSYWPYLLLLTGVAIDPTLVYFSRYLRNDIIVVFFQFFTFYSLISAWTMKTKILVIFSSLAAQFILKENSYITAFALVFYLAIQQFVNPINLKSFIKNNKLHLFTGFAVFMTIFSLFYSAFFHHPSGILDGLFRKSLAYWFDQHNQSRINGPFMYQSLMMLSYAPILLILPMALSLNKLKVFVYCAFFGVIIYLTALIPEVMNFYKPLKMLNPMDAGFFCFYTALFFLLSKDLLFHPKKERFLFTYLFFGSLITYSYVGEKVPWLSTYPIFWGILLLAHLVEEKVKISQVKIIFTIFFITSLYRTSMIIIHDPNNPKELIAQVHSTKILEDLIMKVDQAQVPLGHKVLISQNLTWPLVYYFYPKTPYQHVSLEPQKYYYLFFEQSDDQWMTSIKGTHHIQLIPFRKWWWPDFQKFRLWDYFMYGFFRIAKNEPYQHSIYFAAKKDL